MQLQTSEYSARGLCEKCSVFLGEVGSDFWAALLQLGDVAIIVIPHSRKLNHYFQEPLAESSDVSAETALI